MSGAAEGERWAVKKGVERYNSAPPACIYLQPRGVDKLAGRRCVAGGKG